MYNSQNVTQALEALRAEIANEGRDLAQKEADLKASTLEKQNIDNLLKTEVPELNKEEAEVKKLKEEIEHAKRKLPEIESKHRRLAEEVTQIRLAQSRKNVELQKTQRDYAEMLRKSGKK